MESECGKLGTPAAAVGLLVSEVVLALSSTLVLVAFGASSFEAVSGVFDSGIDYNSTVVTMPISSGKQLVRAQD